MGNEEAARSFYQDLWADDDAGFLKSAAEVRACVVMIYAYMCVGDEGDGHSDTHIHLTPTNGLPQNSPAARPSPRKWPTTPPASRARRWSGCWT